MSEQRTEQVVFRLTPTEAQLLDNLAKRLGYGRAVMARAIVRDVLDDDARAHGEQGLDRRIEKP